MLRRSLQLVSPSQDSARCSDALTSEVRDHASGREFVELVERRHAYLMARARVISEERREAREQEAGR